MHTQGDAIQVFNQYVDYLIAEEQRARYACVNGCKSTLTSRGKGGNDTLQLVCTCGKTRVINLVLKDAGLDEEAATFQQLKIAAQKYARSADAAKTAEHGHATPLPTRTKRAAETPLTVREGKTRIATRKRLTPTDGGSDCEFEETNEEDSIPQEGEQDKEQGPLKAGINTATIQGMMALMQEKDNRISLLEKKVQELEAALQDVNKNKNKNEANKVQEEKRTYAQAAGKGKDDANKAPAGVDAQNLDPAMLRLRQQLRRTVRSAPPPQKVVSMAIRWVAVRNNNRQAEYVRLRQFLQAAGLSRAIVRDTSFIGRSVAELYVPEGRTEQVRTALKQFLRVDITLTQEKMTSFKHGAEQDSSVIQRYEEERRARLVARNWNDVGTRAAVMQPIVNEDRRKRVMELAARLRQSWQLAAQHTAATGTGTGEKNNDSQDQNANNNSRKDNENV